MEVKAYAVDLDFIIHMLRTGVRITLPDGRVAEISLTYGDKEAGRATIEWGTGGIMLQPAGEDRGPG